MSKPLILEMQERMQKNIMTAYLTTRQTVSNNTTINLTAKNSVGDKLTLSSNAIIIGTGVSMIKVSGYIFYEFQDTGSYVWGRICKNAVQIAGTISSKSAGFQSSAIPTVLVNVKEGDKITLSSGDLAGASATLRGDLGNTQLTVEVVE